jgi:hypothetical protein
MFGGEDRKVTSLNTFSRIEQFTLWKYLIWRTKGAQFCPAHGAVGLPLTFRVKYLICYVID